MQKIILYMGLNDKDSKHQEVDVITAYKQTMNILLNVGIEGATISEAVGLYKHIDNTIVEEKTLRIELMFVDLEVVKKAVKLLKITFNQETIAVNIQQIESELW